MVIGLFSISRKLISRQSLSLTDELVRTAKPVLDWESEFNYCFSFNIHFLINLKPRIYSQLGGSAALRVRENQEISRVSPRVFLINCLCQKQLIT